MTRPDGDGALTKTSADKYRSEFARRYVSEGEKRGRPDTLVTWLQRAVTAGAFDTADRIIS